MAHILLELARQFQPSRSHLCHPFTSQNLLLSPQRLPPARWSYSVDASTGATTLIGSLGSFNGTANALVFGADGTLYIAGNSLYTVNTLTGAGTDIGNMGVANVFGLASADNITLYGMANQQVFTIDTATAAAGPQVTFNPTLGFAAGSAFFSEAGAPIPEPSSAALLAIGLLGAMAALRRPQRGS